MATQSATTDQPWQQATGEPVLFILDADNGTEERLLTQWIEDNAGDANNAEQVVLPILYGRKGKLETGPLDGRLEISGDTHVVPLRVVWLPAKAARQSKPRLRDLFAIDQRHPGRLMSQIILRSDPKRAQCVVGKSATLDELRTSFAELDIEDGFAAFVVRRAGLALDVAERRVQGNRYKVPRFVAEGIAQNADFQKAIRQLATETGRPAAELHREARGYMKEMVARPTVYFIDFMARFARYFSTLSYGKEIIVDPVGIERTREVLRDHPTALLWTHKSHVDGMAVVSVMFDNDLPAPHTFGGINMAFHGMGFLGRKSGVIYIRRSFQDNPVYKLVLRHYLGFLMEKRFPFSWAFEGTRSRVGKLMPPRYGLLKYIIEAAHATNASDLHFVPVSISYDLIGDADDYAIEQAGAKKRPESLSWFLGYLKKLRSPMGRLYFDFAEPVVLPGRTPPVDEVDMSRIAFEVAVRVNALTPVTMPSLVCMVLLRAAPRALTLIEIATEINELTEWLEQRSIRMTSHLERDNVEQQKELARIAIDRGLISRYAEGDESVYVLAEDQYPVASYYRNTIVHYFVAKAIIEIALAGIAGQQAGSRQEAFWSQTERLRDLFKFEFFYSPKPVFRQELDSELSMYDADWAETLERDGSLALLSRTCPLVAHATLLPFIEAYGIVAEVLERLEPDEGIEMADCVSRSLKYGQQRYLQRRISSKASIAKALFENGYRLFSHLSLTDAGNPGGAAGRKAMSREFAELSERLGLIANLRATAAESIDTDESRSLKVAGAS